MREPGTNWDYENYDTLLAVYAMKLAIGDPQEYLQFPRAALLDKIGMRNTLLSTDRFGDFIFSSQVYTNARDLARFGLLYLNGGMWNGERLLSEEWIEFARTPAPSTAEIGNFYGGQWWLVSDDRDDVPARRILDRGESGSVRHRRAVARPRDRAPRPRLGPPGLQPLGPDARGAQGLLSGAVGVGKSEGERSRDTILNRRQMSIVSPGLLRIGA